MKCQLCEKEVESKKLYAGDYEQINGAVLGKGIDLQRHKTCLRNLNNLVVIPNRLRLTQKCL